MGGGGQHAGLPTLPLGLQGPALDRAWRAAPASRGPGRGPRPGSGGSPGLGAADGAERSAAGGGVGEGAGQGKCDVSAEPFYTSFPGLRQSRCCRRRRPRVLESVPPGAGLRVPARRAPPPRAGMSGVKKQKTVGWSRLPPSSPAPGALGSHPAREEAQPRRRLGAGSRRGRRARGGKAGGRGSAGIPGAAPARQSISARRPWEPAPLGVTTPR